MSLFIKCTIEVHDQQYEAGTKDTEIFTVFRHVASTGAFADTPAELIDRFIGSTAWDTERIAKDKLRAIKGDYGQE